MEYVSLGRGGPTVSAVGLGMWQAGGKAWGADVRDADCRKAMERAVDLGINLVDTAEAYGDGHSEQVMSRAIKDLGRDRVFIATKVGGWHLRADDVKKACAGSLKRLGVRSVGRAWSSPGCAARQSECRPWARATGASIKDVSARRL